MTQYLAMLDACAKCYETLVKDEELCSRNNLMFYPAL